MLLVIIVGARPQFIKIAPLVLDIEKSSSLDYYLIHTGQHYNVEMSEVFFTELGLPKPDINLEVGSGSHGKQTGRMLIAIEKQLVKVKPDLRLVLGDTNSTLAGALASVKLIIPVVHLEAGVRSNDFCMPEEINRRLVDQVSEILFAPTENAVRNLLSEGIAKEKVHLTGDIIYDALLQNIPMAKKKKQVLKELGLNACERYVVFTLHRERNVDNASNLSSTLEALRDRAQHLHGPIHKHRRLRQNRQHGSREQHHHGGARIDCGKRITDSLIGKNVEIVNSNLTIPRGHKLILDIDLLHTWRQKFLGNE